MSIEAMKQALDATSQFVEKELTVGQRYTNAGQQLLEAIEALRAAIQQAEAQQVENSTATTKPVATVKTINGVTIGYLEKRLPNETPLYTHPAPSVPDDVVRDAERFRCLNLTEEAIAVVDSILADKVGGKQ